MANHPHHENATSNILAWSPHGANVEPAAEEDAGADADEPPDERNRASALTPSALAAHGFRKTPVSRQNSYHESLLTRALHSQSDEEPLDRPASTRRRSLRSNVSLASTADHTSDTGITTPARTGSPSPPMSVVGFAPLVVSPTSVRVDQAETRNGPVVVPQSQQDSSSEQATRPAAQKKRCISFACLSKPAGKPATAMPPPPLPKIVEPTPTPPYTPKRSCIKFACPAAPKTPPQHEPEQKTAARKMLAPKAGDSPTTRKLRSPSAGSRGGRSLTPRRTPQSPAAVRPKKYITAESQDLEHESSRFHEFASDTPQQDDWIRYDYTAGLRLTIDDTLKKELAIRRLGRECEEEAQQEEEDEADASKEGDDNEEEDDNDDDDDDDNDDEVEAEEAEFPDDHSGYGSDNEVGFASSDDEDDDLVLWTTRQPLQARLSGATPIYRRRDSASEQSDSSYSGVRRHQSKPKNRELVHRFRPGTPELPDSTDFVCGTLDEDRPIEDAYLSCLAARKQEKQRIIPQDIDPSFPTSDPEDDNDDAFGAQQHDSDDHLWLHGELEDLHHGQERTDRRKKKADSPKRYHSPPPKRHHSPAPKRLHSPAPKGRGRSPRRPAELSPRRTRSPARQLLASPPASPRPGRGPILFRAMPLAPGLTQTKSLPRAPAMFRHAKPHKRGRANTLTRKAHVRGAVDIVMGLEQKRQRRREKFHQKYCNRARKGQVHEKRPQPGVGAVRMRELGLIMAGRTEQGNYVLSF